MIESPLLAKGQKLFGAFTLFAFGMICFTSYHVIINSKFPQSPEFSNIFRVSLLYYKKTLNSCQTLVCLSLQKYDYPELLKWIPGIKKPPLYIITPTWPRPVQLAELTRLGYVLKVNFLCQSQAEIDYLSVFAYRMLIILFG